MAPSRSRQSAVDSDTSMAEASEPPHQLEVDPMVSSIPTLFSQLLYTSAMSYETSWPSINSWT